jgi:hypothetical protein
VDQQERERERETRKSKREGNVCRSIMYHWAWSPFTLQIEGNQTTFQTKAYIMMKIMRSITKRRTTIIQRSSLQKWIKKYLNK